MIAKAPEFRTLANALADSKPVIGDAVESMGRNQALMRNLRNFARGADTAIDTVAINAGINAGVPDDAAQRTVHKMGGRLGDRLDPDNQLRALKHGFGPEDMGTRGPGIPQQARKPGSAPGRPALKSTEPKPNVFDKGAGLLESGLHIGGYAMMGTELVPLIGGGAAGLLGMNGLKHTLETPRRMMETNLTSGLTARQALNDGLQLGFSALQTYGVAKGFFQQLDSMKQMYADVMGVDPRSVSTMTILTGKMPPVLAGARSHFITEYGSRGLIQAVGWGLIARDLMKGHANPEEIAGGRIGLTAGIVPGLINMGVDMFMGTSTIEVYSGFKKAFESGETIPAGAYAQFLLASSPELQKRKVGRQVALELGTEYAIERASPGEILRQMNDGRFKARIDKMIAADEAALAAHPQATHQQKNSMVDRIGGQRQQPGKVVGPFTGRLHQESSLHNKELH